MSIIGKKNFETVVLDHLDLNDFLFLITFLALLEAKFDFIEPKNFYL